MGFKYKQIFMEVLMKTMATIALGCFAMRVFQNFMATRNSVPLLLLVSECITIFLVIFARFTDTRDFSPIPVIATIMGTFYFFAIVLGGGVPLISENMSAAILVIAICWQIYAKVYLGRSFGLLPACRTVIDTGPYRIVRHPLYLGYFVGHMAFLLNNFSIWNVEVFTALYILQFIRIYYEERTLSKNKQYLEYKNRVKYRFIPFII